VPGAIVRFKKIHTLLLDTNEIIRLPTYLPKTLKILSARNNKIEFTELPRFHFFEKLELEGNPFGMKVANVISIPVKQAVSSLIQMAAQTYLENGFVYNNKMLPWNVCEMLDTARYCPCFKVIA
jgi:Leucine-rich repeat (LRR) protein